MAAIYDNDGNGKFVCLQNDNEQAEWIQYMEHYIDEADSHRILIVMSHPYILTFLHYIEPFLSDVELGEVLNYKGFALKILLVTKMLVVKSLLNGFNELIRKA